MNFETLAVVHYVIVDFLPWYKRTASKLDTEKTAPSWQHLERLTAIFSLALLEAVAYQKDKWLKSFKFYFF